LFWGWRVGYNSIFRDVLSLHDPANECLVTGLFRIAPARIKYLFDAATRSTVLVFLTEARGILRLA
jgi:hypothetical protein